MGKAVARHFGGGVDVREIREVVDATSGGYRGDEDRVGAVEGEEQSVRANAAVDLSIYRAHQHLGCDRRRFSDAASLAR
ncbi:hypothetical protein [Caulobacter vibrioides]|uniref:hypothetical protein n=1 Tax=Caulobacter vibrioides TaxID=155892 RepID=UPI000F7490D3|nr:hypothetical protein [Caulobacter vibrioides]